MNRFIMAWVILVTVSAACLAGEAPINDIPKAEGFIREWLVLGPFKNPEIKGAEIGDVTRAGYDTDYLVSLGGEAAARIDSSTTVQTPEGPVGPPAHVTVDHRGCVCLDPLFGVNVPLLVSYSFCRVRSETDQTVYAHLGSDDAAKVWVNGELVFSVWVEHRWARRDQNQFAVRLRKGLNDILVKVDNRREDTEFVLELYEEAYEKARFAERVKGLVVRPTSTKNAASGPLELVVEFDPHTPLYSPAAKVTVESPGGRTLATAETRVGVPASVNIPSGAGQVVFLKASVKNFGRRALSGTAAAVLGDWKAARADYAARLRALEASQPRRMRDAAWRRHLALARYYDYTLSLMWDRDEYTTYALLKRGAYQHTLLPKLARVIEAMESGRDSLTTRRGGFRAAYISQADGSPQPYVINVPQGYDPSRAWPLIVNLHGLGGTSGRPEDLEGRADAIIVQPDGRGQANGWRNLAERDCLDVIADVRAAYNVDPDRIYLKGASMGGFGTWNIAAKYPDVFAAALAFCGGPAGEPLENLKNVPFLAFHDKTDWGVPSDNSRWGVRLLQSWGYPACLIESEGFGHDAGAGAKAIGFDADAWLLTHRRNAAPREIVYTTRSAQRGRAYWAAIRELAEPSLPATLRAVAGKGNHLYVQAENAAALTFDLPPALFDAHSPLVVTIGNTIIRVDASQPEAIFLHSGAKGWELAGEAPGRVPDVRGYEAGSLSNLHRGEPLLIVRGTSGSEELVKAMAGLAADLSCRTQPGRPMDVPSIPVKRDCDVTEDDIRRLNLVLIGGPSQNSVTARAAGGLCVREKDGQVTIDGGASYDMKGRGYGMYYYNPLAPRRLIYVLSSEEPTFYDMKVSPAGEALAGTSTVDFALCDCLPRRFVRSIAWGSDWRPARRFLDLPLVPGAFATNASQWDEVASSLLRTADAAYVLRPPRGAEWSGQPSGIDTANMTWADYENLEAVRREPVLAAEVSGEELLAIDKVLKEKKLLDVTPAVDPASVGKDKMYRVVMFDWCMSDLAQAREQNLYGVRFVTYDWVGDMRRRIAAR